jgi:hypothetical protein
MKWTLRKISVGELKEYEQNPRSLTAKGLDDLEKSIKKFGVAEPLVLNTDYTICGGHGRLKILQRLGIKEVDCYLPERKLTRKEFEELNIRLNKNIAGIWNFDTLANLFENDFLLDVGFSNQELGLNINEINKTDEWEGMPDFESGRDFFKLNIQFENEADREEFVRMNKIQIGKKTINVWSTWWPFKEKEDKTSVRYE